MILYLKISSKKLFYLKKFANFFFKFKRKLGIIFFTKKKNKKTKKIMFTILKSPHVNKGAQEQFEHKIYEKTITVYSNDFLKFFYAIKMLKQNLYSMINIKLHVNSINFVNHGNLRLNPDNFILKFKKRKLNIKTEKYLNILDVYGEILFKTTV